MNKLRKIDRLSEDISNLAIAVTRLSLALEEKYSKKGGDPRMQINGEKVQCPICHSSDLYLKVMYRSDGEVVSKWFMCADCGESWTVGCDENVTFGGDVK